MTPLSSSLEAAKLVSVPPHRDSNPVTSWRGHLWRTDSEFPSSLQLPVFKLIVFLTFILGLVFEMH